MIQRYTSCKNTLNSYDHKKLWSTFREQYQNHKFMNKDFFLSFPAKKKDFFLWYKIILAKGGQSKIK